MSAIVDCTVPAAEFELGRALRGVDFRQAELEGTITTPAGDESGSVALFLWVSGADAAVLDGALRDAVALGDVRLLDDFGDRFLFRVECEPAGEGFLGTLSDLDAAILEATGDADRWAFELRFHTAAALSAFQTAQYEERSHVDVRRVAEIADHETESPASAMGLTSAQRDALRVAFEEGYFAVPRGTNLVELGDRLGVSSQSLSERLRRAEAKVLAATLLAEPEASSDLDSEFR